MKTSISSFCCISLIFLWGCLGKDPMQTPPPAINIQGFDLRDTNGIFYTHVGEADNDWKFSNSLSDKELKLFDFEVYFSLDNTAKVELDSLIAYPNPCLNYLIFYKHKADSLVYKIVVTDSKLTVLTKYAVKAGNHPFAITFNDPYLFPIGASRRIYFSVSAKDFPDYEYGWGDIKICDKQFPEVLTCF